MKKWLALLGVALLLCGCAAQETMETVYVTWEETQAEPRSLTVSLPGEEASTVGAEGRYYLANDYAVSIETLPGGSLDSTLRSVTGFSREELTVMETREDEGTRYEFVWAAAGETGDQIGHGVILSDGAYHYVLTVLQDAAAVGDSQAVWSNVYQSFSFA